MAVISVGLQIEESHNFITPIPGHDGQRQGKDEQELKAEMRQRTNIIALVQHTGKHGQQQAGKQKANDGSRIQ